MQRREISAYNGPPSNVCSSAGSKGSLTINVRSAMEWNKPHALQECTNSSALTPGCFYHPRSATAYTPDTSYTFGVPNPTNYYPHRLSRSSLSTPYSASRYHEETETRRMRRYSEAEQALAHVAEHITETPPAELQIRALKQAATYINQQAKDAREKSAKLRTILSDRDVDPAQYENAQRARWMEEKRQLLMDEELKAFTVTVHHLEGGMSAPSSSSGEALELLKAKSPVASTTLRAKQNLVRFLETTSSRTHIRKSSRRSSLEANWSPRRMTMSDVTPMRLRPWSMTSAFAESVKADARSKSHDVSLSPKDRDSPLSAPAAVETRKAQRRSVPSRKMLIRSSLASVAEDVTDASVPSEHVPEFIEGPSTENTTVSSAPSTPSASETASEALTPRPNKLFAENNDDDTNGTAMIYYPSSISENHRAEILADQSLTAIELPDYAHELLNEFEGKSSVSLSLHPGRSRVRRSLSSDWSVLADTPRLPPIAPAPSTRDAKSNVSPSRSSDSRSPSPRKRSHLPDHPRPSSQIGLLKPKPSLTLGGGSRSSPRKLVHSLLSVPEAESPASGSGSGSSTSLSVVAGGSGGGDDEVIGDEQRSSQRNSLVGLVSVSGSAVDVDSQESIPKMLRRKLSKRIFPSRSAKGVMQ